MLVVVLKLLLDLLFLDHLLLPGVPLGLRLVFEDAVGARIHLKLLVVFLLLLLASEGVV